MVPYRIYKMSPDNRIVGIADEIEFDSDQDAIKHANTKLDGLDLEVWHGPRMVIRLKSTDRVTGRLSLRPTAKSHGCQPAASIIKTAGDRWHQSPR